MTRVNGRQPSTESSSRSAADYAFDHTHDRHLHSYCTELRGETGAFGGVHGLWG